MKFVTFTHYKLIDQQRARVAFKIMLVTAAQTGFPNENKALTAEK